MREKTILDILLALTVLSLVCFGLAGCSNNVNHTGKAFYSDDSQNSEALIITSTSHSQNTKIPSRAIKTLPGKSTP